jgi:hypothetical protein
VAVPALQDRPNRARGSSSELSDTMHVSDPSKPSLRRRVFGLTSESIPCEVAIRASTNFQSGSVAPPEPGCTRARRGLLPCVPSRQPASARAVSQRSAHRPSVVTYRIFSACAPHALSSIVSFLLPSQPRAQRSSRPDLAPPYLPAHLASSKHLPTAMARVARVP